MKSTTKMLMNITVDIIEYVNSFRLVRVSVYCLVLRNFVCTVELQFYGRIIFGWLDSVNIKTPDRYILYAQKVLLNLSILF